MADQGAVADVSLVDEYLRTEFQPKYRAVSRVIRDPEVRRLAVEKTGRYFYHWNEERKLQMAREAVVQREKDV